jgi:hypothetical protein
LTGSGTVPHQSSDELDGALRDVVREAVVVADPLNFIARGAAAHQYDPAAEAIAARLNEASGIFDLQVIIQEEFARWFSTEGAGPAERYAAMAASIWRSRTLILGDQR